MKATVIFLSLVIVVLFCLLCYSQIESHRSTTELRNEVKDLTGRVNKLEDETARLSSSTTSLYVHKLQQQINAVPELIGRSENKIGLLGCWKRDIEKKDNKPPTHNLTITVLRSLAVPVGLHAGHVELRNRDNVVLERIEFRWDLNPADLKQKFHMIHFSFDSGGSCSTFYSWQKEQLLLEDVVIVTRNLGKVSLSGLWDRVNTKE